MLVLCKEMRYQLSIAAEVKTLRKKAFLTQEEFANVLHVSAITINRWENEKSTPNLTAMKNIRAFCNENNLPFSGIEAEWLKDKEE